MMALYQKSNFKRSQNVLTVFRKLFPSLSTCTKETLPAALNAIAYADLRERVLPDLSGFAADALADMYERKVITEQNKAQYFRDVRDFIRFAEGLGNVKEALPISEPWCDFMAPLDSLCPTDEARIAQYLAAGIETIAGLSVHGRSVRQLSSRFSNKRSHFKRFAAECTRAGLTPDTFARSVLVSLDYAQVPILRNKTVVGKGIAFYDIRKLWNELAPLYSAELPLWGDHIQRDGLPPDAWPEPVFDGWRQLILNPENGFEPNTIKNHTNTMRNYLGKLAKLDISLAFLTDGLSGRDAIRLLFAGMPREIQLELGGEFEAVAICRKLERDHAFRDRVLALQRRLEGCFDGFESAENPFLTLVMRERFECGEYAAARCLINLASWLCRNSFFLRERHVRWIEERWKKIEHLSKQNPTRYQFKKRAVFKNPGLWMELLKAQLSLVNVLLARPPQRHRDWAASVRLCVYVTLGLLFPLRAENYVNMRLGANFDRRTYSLRFEPDETKNGAELNFQLPETGPLAIVRQLVDVYLDLARPVLLKGRDSDFFLVLDQGLSASNLKIGEKALNGPLAKYSIEHFSKVLPPEIRSLNPHLMRHIAACHWIVVEGRPERAAQVLGDKLQTVLEHYSDLSYSAGKNLKQYYENLRDELFLDVG